ncbi:MAG: damage-inducible protein DinB [Geminicoccaceae bacterium]|jgi:uncharacterized damage-inducible protein DinB|nr:damage-inducible protein DinB [Geminicoccaceae bacterium]
MTHLRRLLDYDIWANRQTLASLGADVPPPQSLKWMAHIVGAECLWLARLRRESSPLPVWPALSVLECGERLADLARQWPTFLDAHLESLGESISYTNSQGEAWSNTVEEILTHVTVHSAYHRGQIASDLRAAGMTPAYTDYIHAVRRGFVP